MIDLALNQLDMVKRILAEHVPEAEARAFGSRVRGRARRFSDLDLVLGAEEPIDPRGLEALKDAFSESDLPIRVDVLDWQTIPESFRNVIEGQFEVIHKAGQAVHRK
jgi:predicted nucleotidyltransferase